MWQLLIRLPAPPRQAVCPGCRKPVGVEAAFEQDAAGNMRSWHQTCLAEDRAFYAARKERQKSEREKRERAATVCANVYARVCAAGDAGVTCDEIEAVTGLSDVSARMNELARVGRVRPSQERRPTRNGRSAIVWVAIG